MRIPLLFLAGCLTALAQPSLTIYNQRFAVVRDVIPLDLKQGMNTVQFTGATVHLEPDSVMLRDPTGRTALKVMEQNFRAEPISEGLLLNLFEGKELDFEITHPTTGEKRTIRGRIIRSGYVLHNRGMQQYDQSYARAQASYAQTSSQPIIEVAGRLQFSLPGRPLFPALANDAILKPTLDWRIHADRDAKLNAEISYVSGGMGWKADYNMVAPEAGDKLEMTGWITMDNQSGKDFENARIKLVAGDVSKIQPGISASFQMQAMAGLSSGSAAPSVTERSFDEYHLYSLPLPTTLHDRETKQVEFLRAASVASTRIYLYDGARIDPRRYSGWDVSTVRNQPEYGTESNPKVWVMREFENTGANGLGVALPKGRVRFYRRDQGGALEFTGENNIDHTPRNEKVRVYTGDAFDIVGERKRTNFQIDNNKRWIDESFEIRLRNRKKESAEVRVVEHLYRWVNWSITAQTLPYRKTESRAAEFLVNLAPDREQVLTYTVHYTW